VCLLIFYSNTKLPTMNYLYFLRIFWCCLWGIIFVGSKFQFRKNSVRPTRQRQKPISKKITVACPTDKGDMGRLTIIANEGAGPGLFEWRTVCFSPFNLQSNFVSRFSPSTVIQIWWYLFMIIYKISIYSFMTFFVCNSISWMLFIHLILFLISTTYK
jgi:hypothetical protein